MAWKTIDRKQPTIPPDAAPLLNDAVRQKIRSFVGRYETARAALLPALHVVQDTLGHLSPQAQKEIAEELGLHPSEVFDAVGFYSHFWTKPRGRKVIVVCRSLSCSLLGGEQVLEAFKEHLGIDEHQTTADGKYSLMTEECLGQCEDAPCVLIGEKKHCRVRPEDVPRILADPNNDKVDVARSDLYDGVPPEVQSDGMRES